MSIILRIAVLINLVMILGALFVSGPDAQSLMTSYVEVGFVMLLLLLGLLAATSYERDPG
jgi:ABC-type Na+ efflux pump permease subunit